MILQIVEAHPLAVGRMFLKNLNGSTPGCHPIIDILTGWKIFG
jgi:hypothetical protein